MILLCEEHIFCWVVCLFICMFSLSVGRSVPGCQKFDLCFGGRRLFCKTRYEDLGNMCWIYYFILRDIKRSGTTMICFIFVVSMLLRFKIGNRGLSLKSGYMPCHMTMYGHIWIKIMKRVIVDIFQCIIYSQ